MKNKAFTLTEILIVTIILGIMASFIFPAYQRSLNLQYARRAKMNVLAIYGAAKIFNAKNSPPLSSDLGNLTAINAAIGTNIADTQYNYRFVAASGTVSGQRTDGNQTWSITLNQGIINCTNNAGWAYTCR